MYNAAIEAGDLVNSIVTTVDPPNKSFHVFISDLLSALSSGLAFLAIPEAAALAGAAATIAPTFLKAIQQAPSVAKSIWPPGTVQRDVIEIGQIHNQLSTVLDRLSPRITNALATVQGRNQTDISAFLAFAQQGAFSNPRDQWPDIASDTKGLLVGFTTFLVFELLLLDGWHVSVALGVNSTNMSGSDARCPDWQCDCGKFLDLGCTSYDNHSQCKNNYWWYGRKTGNVYTLSKDPYNDYFQSASHNEKDPTQLMQAIFKYGWSSGELLLVNAGLCVLLSYLSSISSLSVDIIAAVVAVFSPSDSSQPCPRPFVPRIYEGKPKLDYPNDTLYSFTTEHSRWHRRLQLYIAAESNSSARLAECVVHAPTSDVTGSHDS